mmetsp:Transcript_27568/g.30696  ORF Transcript_27568/g.30696 Transcript_27568/m.30696 type:complete len:236 (+) Transcript_27568:4-711(+)
MSICSQEKVLKVPEVSYNEPVFGMLPGEIIEEITYFFADNLPSLLNFGLTSKLMLSRVQNDRIWKHLYHVILNREGHVVKGLKLDTGFSWRKALQSRTESLLNRPKFILSTLEYGDAMPLLALQRMEHQRLENYGRVHRLMQGESITKVNIGQFDTLFRLEFVTNMARKLRFGKPYGGTESEHSGRFLVGLRCTEDTAFHGNKRFHPVFWEDPIVMMMGYPKITKIHIVATTYAC